MRIGAGYVVVEYTRQSCKDVKLGIPNGYQILLEREMVVFSNVLLKIGTRQAPLSSGGYSRIAQSWGGIVTVTRLMPDALKIAALTSYI